MIKLLFYHYFPLLAILCYAYYDVFYSKLMLILGTIFLIPYFAKYCTKGKVHPLIWNFFIIVIIGSILNLLTTENGIGGSIIFLGTYALAIYSLNNLKTIQWIMMGIGLFLLYFLFIQIFIIGIRVDEIFESVGQSKNYPGCLLVQISCFWGMTKLVNYKSLPFLYPIAAVVFAFFLDGRSSLGIMIVVAIYCLAFRSRRYTISTIALTFAALFYYREFLLESLETTRLFNEGYETSRYLLWESYLSNLDLPSLLFGLETKDLPYLKQYNGNPHNSFFNFHYRMGLLGLMALVVLLIKSIRKLLRTNQKEICVFLLLLWARMFFDTCIISATDFIVYTMMFYPFCMNIQTKYDRIEEPKNILLKTVIYLKMQLIRLL